MTSRPRVLLVDDDESVVSALAVRLAREFDVSIAVGPEEAITRVVNDPAFAVIVVDIRMPGCDGNALLARVRDLDPNIVRMVLTGHADTETAIASINEGHCFRFLCKPCPFDRVRAAIVAGVEQYRLQSHDRELTEARLREMSRQIARSERLATLGSMAASAGHELSNIAAALEGVLGLVEPVTDDTFVLSREDYGDLVRVSRHVSHFGRQLLGFGRGGATDSARECVDLVQAIRDVLGMLTVLGATKNVAVSLDVPSGEVPVLLSRTEFEQVLVNLVRNATDALAEVDRDSKRVRLVVERLDDGRVECAVVDNGPGIGDAALDRIFEPYFTTKSAEHGTGLGLAVVRQIVEAANGEIVVDSDPDRGTRFALRFSICEAA